MPNTIPELGRYGISWQKREAVDAFYDILNKKRPSTEAAATVITGLVIDTSEPILD